jgi:hypothetical protein
MDDLRKRPGSRRWHALGLRMRRWCAPGPGMRRRCAPGPGSRTTDGGGGETVSRATEERERERKREREKERESGDEKLLSVARESTGPKILVCGT